MSTAVFERTVVGGVGKPTILYPTAGDGDVREARIEIRDTLYGHCRAQAILRPMDLHYFEKLVIATSKYKRAT